MGDGKGRGGCEVGPGPNSGKPFLVALLPKVFCRSF